MAVTLRLARYGTKGKPNYRIVAGHKGKKRDGRFLEVVGTMNPMVNPPRVNLKKERVEYWISVGAQTTEVVRAVIKKNIPGLIERIEESRDKKKKAARKARKLRSKGKAKK